MKEEEIKKLNIYEKMSCITTAIKPVEKKLDIAITKNKSYKAVSERDVIDNIKPIESLYRVYSYPIKREIVENEVFTKETEYGVANTLFLRLKTIYRFVNLDLPEEFIDIETYGDGLDTGDKAPGKAMTYADKYALLKAYKVSTGSENDEETVSLEGYSNNVKLASPKQVKMLSEYYTGENLDILLTKNNINSIEELPMAKASELISSIIKKGINKDETN